MFMCICWAAQNCITPLRNMTSADILQEAQNVLQKEISGLIRAQNALNESFVRAVELLLHADKVIVCGLGKSGLIGQKIAATFTSIGKTALSLHPVEALHGDIGAVVPERDIALFLSNSGTTAELLRLLPYLRKRSIAVISIIGNMGSPLARLSDVALDASVTAEAIDDLSVPTASTTAALGLGDALAAVLLKASGFTADDFAEFHPLGQIGRNLLLTVADVMHKAAALPIISPDAAFRDALIEMTAKGLGCVCVTDTHHTLVGLITDGDVRRVLQSHEDIRLLRVAEVMTHHPLGVLPETTLGMALALMEDRPKQLSVLPVINADGRCVGVIRIHDIIRADL